MPTRTTRLTAAAAVALLLPLCPAAQDPKPQRAAQSPEPAIVDLDFAGGSLATFVAAVRRAQRDVNIVMAPRADEADVPAMELRGTDIDQALETACMLATGDVEVDVRQIRGRGATIYTILARPRKVRNPNDPEPVPAGQPVQRVFTLNALTMDRAMPDHFVQGAADGLVKPLTVEAVLSAVELATTQDGTAPMLRYHQDSGILIVRGTVAQVTAASEVLAVLHEDLERRHELVQQKLQRERQHQKAEVERQLRERGLLPSEALDQGGR